MCGFAGFIDVSRELSREERQDALRRMEAQIAHRGPDDRQTYDDGVLALVFRRLAIVGLGNGRQPIFNEDASRLVTVNGEIYNHLDLRRRLQDRHVFRTDSDSEVALHLFAEEGAASLERLVGKFAIALWDRPARRLLLARDRLGVKPLYFSRTAKGLLFGSELKALLAHPHCPREIEWADLDMDWKLSSFVRGVHHLPGGHYALYSPGGEVVPVRYWNLAEHFAPADEPARPEAEYVEELGGLLETCIHDRLMSEVPVGVFLSGGVDSSALAAAAARYGARPHCFTIVERNSVSCGDVASAETLARALDLPLHLVLFDLERLLDQLSFGLEAFEYFVWLMDTPRFQQEWLLKHELHRYAKTLIGDEKVMLLGQGADEFCGGYSNPLFPPTADPSWKGYLDSLKRQEAWIRRHESGVPLELAQLFDTYFPGPPQEPGAAPRDTYHDEMMFRLGFLQRYNLWHEDRTAASQGVEARVPYLDHRVVEYLASIPPSAHETLFWDKRILREASRRWLPPEYGARPKVGFLLTADNTSAGRLDVAVALRIYPYFRESYLESADSILSRAALDHEYGELRSTPAPEVAARLLKLMAVAVFERQCRLGYDPAANPLRSPSPLTEVASASLTPWSPAAD
jgi:asparagine synthase (glutamine-hydrolysing)